MLWETQKKLEKKTILMVARWAGKSNTGKEGKCASLTKKSTHGCSSNLFIYSFLTPSIQ